jgi:hypothetical protein
MDDLEPLTPAEITAWKAAMAGEWSAETSVVIWRYLNDARFHARVYLWERQQEAAGDG